MKGSEFNSSKCQPLHHKLASLTFMLPYPLKDENKEVQDPACQVKICAHFTVGRWFEMDKDRLWRSVEEEDLGQVGPMLSLTPGDSADYPAQPGFKAKMRFINVLTKQAFQKNLLLLSPSRMFNLTSSGNVLWPTSCCLPEDSPVSLKLNGLRELTLRGRGISLSCLLD